MPHFSHIKRFDLSSADVRASLPVRQQPYWQLLLYGRHVGFEKSWQAQHYWLARFRTNNGGYRRKRVGRADPDVEDAITYQQALEAAHQWFAEPANQAIASEARPIGSTEHLSVCPIGDRFTVGHALHDYVEWKRIVAARTHFTTNLSLINWHIVPRLASIPLDEFNGDRLTQFARAILQSAPKRGNERPKPDRAIHELDEEALRKRKKTLNTLISILRVAFRMAWENGKTDDQRCWRCLRRVTTVDRPRSPFLTRDECRALLNACRDDLRLLVLGALYTGCRAGELSRMTVRDIATEGYGVYVMPSKSRRPRFVFLPDEGMMFFIDMCRRKRSSDLVFTRQNGRSWHSAYRHLFRDAVDRSGIPTEFVFHGLRHTYASQLVQAGTPLLVVAHQLGHANIKTVSRIYGHLAPQTREMEIQARFRSLDPCLHAMATEHQHQLAGIRSRFHHEDWRTLERLEQASSWPIANHFGFDGELARELRHRNVGR